MKIMASDFDGTIFFGLLGDGSGFKETDLKAIEEFRKAGHQFGICTGRPLFGISSQSDGILDYDFYILSSGSVILDKDCNLLCEYNIPHKTMVTMANEFYEKRGDVWIHAHHGIYVKDKYSSVVKFSHQIVHDFSEIPEGLISSVSFAMDNEEDAKNTCVYVSEKYPNVDAFYNDQYVDIVAKGVSKGNALKQYAKICNASISYGIGDNYNDITLLEGADESFTFKSSPQEVKESATYIVNSVAEAIRQIL